MQQQLSLTWFRVIGALGRFAEDRIIPVLEAPPYKEYFIMRVLSKYNTFLRPILIDTFSFSRSHGFVIMTFKQYHQNKSSKRQKTAPKLAQDGSHEEVLAFDVRSILSKSRILEQNDDAKKIGNDGSPPTSSYAPLEKFSEVDVEISELSSTGDGLGLSSTLNHVYVVPFTVPGDVVRAKVVNYFPQSQYTLTDFIEVIKESPQRDDKLIKCPYFAKCAGCQFQMLPYEMQLRHKKTIIEKAFHNFSSLAPEVLPAVGDTIGSPLQYGYRTKLTPHFDGPPGSLSRKARRNPSDRKGFAEVPPIGFMLKGTRKTIDIEDCPIGTDAIREGIRLERKKIAKDIAQYKKGATILLRETTFRKPLLSRDPRAVGDETTKDSDAKNAEGVDQSARPVHGPEPNEDWSECNDAQDGKEQYIEEKTYITDQRAISTEYIDDFAFQNTAGAFFQNNNSILPRFTTYIRDHVTPSQSDNQTQSIKYLIDAYCGSGLFTVTLSSLFSSSIGIDIAEASIASARDNAANNKIPNASFMTADASKLFDEVTFPPEKTVVIIDPPRKGCDGAFLQQLLRFGPQRVVYVSCNVHTQARDVGVLVEGKGVCRYKLESLQGFDFFPQTGHVEGVAVLSRSA